MSAIGSRKDAGGYPVETRAALAGSLAGSCPLAALGTVAIPPPARQPRDRLAFLPVYMPVLRAG
jgi:hypothetical protein